MARLRRDVSVERGLGSGRERGFIKAVAPLRNLFSIAQVVGGSRCRDGQGS